MTDRTHDKAVRSWVRSADRHPSFPIQNLPLGSFIPAGGGAARCGVAIGDEIVDLRTVAATGLLPGPIAEAAATADLRPLLALGRSPLAALRHAVFDMLTEGAEVQSAIAPALHRAAECTLLLPTRPGGYTDFYAGIVHATNVGRLLRPDNPLMPNYKWVPIGYHGRTSTIRPSGTPVRRPVGQLKSPDEPAPMVGPSQRLDYEVELGIWIAGGNAMGDAIPIAAAPGHIAGVTLLNDWSARYLQAWEYVPLGPFLAKNFATTISPWLVTMDALAPFQVAQGARPDGDPAPLGYLDDAADQAAGALDIEIEVALATARMRAAGEPPQRLGLTSARHLYWTPAQLVAHHSSNGCALEPGDLLGTGTISAPSSGGFGSLMEISQGGRVSHTLPNGEERRFLEDGDEVVMQARCRRDGFAPIGFGECRAIVTAAPVA